MILVLFLSACSGMGLAKLALGGGPNVAANTQVGKENYQTIGSHETTTFTIGDVKEGANVRPVIRPEGITTTAPVETINQYQFPWWMLALLLLFWELPRSSTMIKWVGDRVKKIFGNN